jgi:hypothetical protein
MSIHLTYLNLRSWQSITDHNNTTIENIKNTTYTTMILHLASIVFLSHLCIIIRCVLHIYTTKNIFEKTIRVYCFFKYQLKTIK